MVHRFALSEVHNNNHVKRNPTHVFYPFQAIGLFAEPQRSLGLSGFIIDAGQKRLYHLLQANHFRAALVYSAAFIDHGDLHHPLWEYCQTVYGWGTTGIILPLRNYGLELLLREFNQNLQCFYSQCRNVWQGLFSAPHYAVVDCSLFPHEVCRTVRDFRGSTFVFRYFHQ